MIRLAVALLALVSLASLAGCPGSGPTLDARTDRVGGEGISFPDGPPGEGKLDALVDAPVDGPHDGVLPDAPSDADGAADGPAPDVADSSVDSPPPDATVDSPPPPKCTSYSDWQCQALSTIVRCTTTCTVGGVERRITCLNSGTCICIRGGNSIGNCTVPATAGCTVCSAAFAKPCCNF